MKNLSYEEINRWKKYEGQVYNYLRMATQMHCDHCRMSLEGKAYWSFLAPLSDPQDCQRDGTTWEQDMCEACFLKQKYTRIKK